jgi:hypothetical protein
LTHYEFRFTLVQKYFITKKGRKNHGVHFSLNLNSSPFESSATIVV